MDTLAHGLWGGAVFGQASRRQWKWAFWLGMMPDLLSFGPFFVYRAPVIFQRWSHHLFGPPERRLIPSYVYHAYHVTHSLVMWAAMSSVCYGTWLCRHPRTPDTRSLAFRYAVTPARALWPLGAWGLHILCDIPTHSIRFFPTPYLWPFRTPFYDGTPWARPRFMILNYLAIALTYAALAAYRKAKQYP